MKNKEAYKQAFKHVHYQKEINLNQRKIPKPLLTLATSLIVLLSTFTVAYAFDVGGIQSKLEVWFHGEKEVFNMKKYKITLIIFIQLIKMEMSLIWEFILV